MYYYTRKAMSTNRTLLLLSANDPSPSPFYFLPNFFNGNIAVISHFDPLENDITNVRRIYIFIYILLSIHEKYHHVRPTARLGSSGV